MWSQGSVVSVMTLIQTGQLRNQGSIPGSGRDSSVPISTQAGSGIHLASL
jgi:hypothetical protein